MQGGNGPKYQFTLANERTFLASVRTALALIAAGVAAVAFVPELGGSAGPEVVGVVLIVLGTALVPASVVHWRRVQAAMRAGQPLPPARHVVLLAVALALVCALVAVLLAVGAAG